MKYPTGPPENPAPTSSWLTSYDNRKSRSNYINMFQTPEDRRAKYALCRANGLNSTLAQALRDWHPNKLNLFIEARKPHQIPLNDPTPPNYSHHPALTPQL